MNMKEILEFLKKGNEILTRKGMNNLIDLVMEDADNSQFSDLTIKTSQIIDYPIELSTKETEKKKDFLDDFIIAE